MAHDPLQRWASLRQRNCQEAQHALVECLEAESQAEAQAHLAERRIQEETQTASALGGSDADVESFAAWLPHARQRLHEAQAALADAQAETARARASLSACRSALRNLEVRQRRNAATAPQRNTERWLHEVDDGTAPATKDSDLDGPP